MNLQAFQFGVETVAPIVGASASLLTRLFEGAVELSQAKAELKGILATAAERLDSYDEIFQKRDAEENERIARASDLHDPNKP